MNTKQKNILGFIFAIVLILSFGFVIIKGSFLIFNKIDKINPNIVIALIAGTVTIIGYFITRYLERKRTIEQQIREQKLPTYEEFLDFLFNVFKQTKNNTEFNNKELEEFFWTMNKKSILWLSDKTLKSYIDWKKLTSNFANIPKPTQTDNIIVMTALENLLKDFRSDIGHKNQNIETGDILSIFINDWNEYTKK